MNLSQPMQALLKACAAHDRVEPQALMARLIDARAREIGVFRLASACREADRDAAGAQTQKRDAAGTQTQNPAVPQKPVVKAFAAVNAFGVFTNVSVDFGDGAWTTARPGILSDAEINAVLADAIASHHLHRPPFHGGVA